MSLIWLEIPIEKTSYLLEGIYEYTRQDLTRKRDISWFQCFDFQKSFREKI